MNSGFAADVQNILGVPVLTNIQFALSKISLPDNVQQAINDAQGAFAGVTKAQAGLQQAAIDAQTNAKKQEGYNACPVCGQMDLLDHLPQGITTYAPGGAFAIGAAAAVVGWRRPRHRGLTDADGRRLLCPAGALAVSRRRASCAAAGFG